MREQRRTILVRANIGAVREAGRLSRQPGLLRRVLHWHRGVAKVSGAVPCDVLRRIDNSQHGDAHRASLLLRRVRIEWTRPWRRDMC
jgi:hypothetical protein